MMMNTVSRIAVAIAMMACFASASAAESDYKVEFLIFSYLPSDTLDDERWPELGTPPQKRSRKLAYASAGQATNYFTRLPKSALELSAKKASLRRSGDYRILFHEAWVQPIGGVKGKHTIRISSGDILDNGLYELDGYVSIDKARYLHFRSELFHTRQLTAIEAEQLSRLNTPAAEQDANLVNSENNDGNTPPTQDDNSINGNRYLTRTAVPDFLTVAMKTGRRMRSKELHYLDHPLMGALVLITPVE